MGPTCAKNVYVPTLFVKHSALSLKGQFHAFIKNRSFEYSSVQNRQQQLAMLF
jgi:hypothetical protein